MWLAFVVLGLVVCVLECCWKLEDFQGMPALVCLSCGNAATMFHQVRCLTRGFRPFEVNTDFLVATHRFIAVCK